MSRALRETSVEAVEYDRQWSKLDDFIKFNPGSRHRRRWILAQVARQRFQSMLDIGCGNGELLQLIQSEIGDDSIHYSGGDLSPVAVERNQKRLPGMKFHVLDVQKQALDARFDLIVCSEVIEHLEDREAAFRNLAKMLQPGGTLILTCPTGRMYETEKHFGHVSHPTVQEVKSLAQANSLRLERLETWGWPFYNLMKWATNVNPEWALKNFGTVQYSASSKLVSIGLYWLNFLNLPGAPLGCQLLAVLKSASGKDPKKDPKKAIDGNQHPSSRL